MERDSTVDVRRLIDDEPLSPAQVRVALLCGAIVFLDGFDAQVMGYVAPALRADLDVSRAALGPVFSSGLVGMMIGALVFGPLADRVGRRPILIACSLIFGIGALLTATASSVESLLALRVFTGLGMGGAMPNTIALTSEYMPRRVRATAVMTMFCGFSIGSAAVGWVAAALIPRFGWQSVFVVGGILPCLITIATVALLPESVRFLIRRGQTDKAARVLARIAPHQRLAGAALTYPEERAPGSFLVGQLFAAGRHKVTLLLWVMFFMNLLDLYFVNSWLPTVMREVGIAEDRAILITTLFQVGGTVGAVVLGRILDRTLSFRMLALIYLAASLGVLSIGQAHSSATLLIAAVFAAGFCVIGAQTSANALAAEYYPPAIRSTGVGWALGIGRLGSILGPLLGGLLAGNPSQLFLLAAIPVLIASLAALTASFAAGGLREKEGPT